ncbi:MAG: hypothetical protein ACRCYP_02360, partial [Alphaproteobacteria bacterium]
KKKKRLRNMIKFFRQTVLILFYCSFFQHALWAIEADALVNKIRIEVMRDVPLKRKQDLICSRGKMCASLQNNHCQNKVLFSLCHIFCSGTEVGFSKSVCVSSRIKAGFQEEEGKFEDGKTVIDYLEEAILSSQKKPMDAYVLCEVVCSTAMDGAFYPFIKEDDKRLKEACKKGCGMEFPMGE